ncbi:MAG: hypothetical protein ABJ372_19450, partial [Hyphomonas sp.]
MKFAAFALAASALALTATADTPDSAAPAEDAPVTYTADQAKADPANWRAVDPERLFIFNTNKGRILIEAFPEVAPKHYEQFAAII